MLKHSYKKFGKNLAPGLLLLFLPVLACAAPGAAKAKPESKTTSAKGFLVVIDPGHGGNDHGTIYDDGHLRVAEKDATLALAQQAAQELRAKKIPVTLTREKDVDLPLGQRTALANRLRADVFISIHMNASLTPMISDAQGIETYILNNTTDATSRRLAQLENMVLGSEAAGGKPEEVDVALILRDLRLDANLSESKRLACGIQDALMNTVARPRQIKDRGVKQALFYVLLGAEMPSVLLEAGFLSHAKDRALVLSPLGRKSIGQAVARAVEEFRRFKSTPQAQRALSTCKVH